MAGSHTDVDRIGVREFEALNRDVGRGAAQAETVRAGDLRSPYGFRTDDDPIGRCADTIDADRATGGIDAVLNDDNVSGDRRRNSGTQLCDGRNLVSGGDRNARAPGQRQKAHRPYNTPRAIHEFMRLNELFLTHRAGFVQMNIRSGRWSGPIRTD